MGDPQWRRNALTPNQQNPTTNHQLREAGLRFEMSSAQSWHKRTHQPQSFTLVAPLRQGAIYGPVERAKKNPASH
jgi:hypothetical protein